MIFFFISSVEVIVMIAEIAAVAVVEDTILLC